MGRTPALAGLQIKNRTIRRSPSIIREKSSGSILSAASFGTKMDPDGFHFHLTSALPGGNKEYKRGHGNYHTLSFIIQPGCGLYVRIRYKAYPLSLKTFRKLMVPGGVGLHVTNKIGHPDSVSRGINLYPHRNG